MNTKFNRRTVNRNKEQFCYIVLILPISFFVLGKFLETQKYDI